MKHIAATILAAWALTGAASVSLAADQAVLERGKALFMSEATPACAVCHTLADAGSAGAIGPNLDEMKPELDRIRKAVTEGVGVMPSFASSLSEEDINAVAEYVANATAGS